MSNVVVVREKVATVVVRAPGPRGAPGSTTYVHQQVSPSAVWTIAHNTGRYPSVTVVDSAGSTVFGDVTYIDDDTLTISFSGGFAGEAFLN